LRISIHTPEQSPADSISISNPLSDTLVVFLNGLALPRAAWSGAINHHISLRRDSRQPLPAALLSYDRYGQGESDPDPTDLDTPYGHGPEASVADLHQLLTQLCPEILPNSKSVEDARLVLVCNSIGCALARLYAAAHPGRVAGYLFLDSMMANTDFVSLFPADPDGDDDDADLVRHARAAFGEHFHPTVPNPEHLDRRNLAALLPHADRPALPAGPGGRVPRLVVVGHDWDEFAEQCEKVRYLTQTMRYGSFRWRGILCPLTSADGTGDCLGPIVRGKVGHQ
jgi:pimeloyl-ACP methyl ester carboxylesterase